MPAGADSLCPSPLVIEFPAVKTNGFFEQIADGAGALGSHFVQTGLDADGQVLGDKIRGHLAAGMASHAIRNDK
jgi:hypothetical protein